MSDANVSAPAVSEEPAPISLWWRICRTILFVFSLPFLYVAVRLTYEQLLAPLYAPSPAIAVGHDTTRIAGPLDADGYVDFLAALDEMAKAGVTPENNAVVPVLEAYGCKSIKPEQREKFYAALGMPVPTEKGDGYFDPYFVSPPNGNYQDPKYRRAWDEFDTATTRPWKRDELPEVAAWLDRHEPHAQVLVAASKRTGFYNPVLFPIAEDPGSQFGYAVHDRVQWFLAHAMQRIAEGDYQSAWDDAEVLHRLSALQTKSPLLQDFLFAHALDGLSWYLRVKIATDAFLPAELRKTLRERERQMRLTYDIEKFDRADRLVFLDLCQREARGGGKNAPSSLVDWNEAMRQVNAWIDASLPPAREADPSLRRLLLTTRTSEPNFPQILPDDGFSVAKAWLQGESLRTLRGRLVSSKLLREGDSILVAVEWSAESSARVDLTDLAFAIAEYQTKHGTLPPMLEDLMPDHVAQLPIDPFSDGQEPFRYERTPLGYRLTTVSQSYPRLKIESPDPQLAQVLPPPAPGVVP